MGIRSSKPPQGNFDNQRHSSTMQSTKHVLNPTLTVHELARHDHKPKLEDTLDPDARDYNDEPLPKKSAVGQGKSPSSSIRTACSGNGSDKTKSKANVASGRPAHTSTPTPADAARPVSARKGKDAEEFRRHTPTAGKRLFNPQTDSPQTHSRPNPQRKHRKSQPSGGLPGIDPPRASTEIVKPRTPNQLPGFERGMLPGSLLNPKREASDATMGDIESSPLILQPVTRPISQEQLIAEVKGIYAGLVMIEGKCIQVDSKQAQLAREALPGQPPKLNMEQWSALTALHRTLLQEHHDFFLASQHPSATPAVKRLATKYLMPARLWKHGIHAYLELLRARLPDCLDHMLAFIYLAYSMMTLLYETVPAFKETWIECLGDLGRYRMAIEDDDIRDRETWTQVARQWYVKASNMSPTTGRLYHHLAILARPNALQQLYFYGKALSVPEPFAAAKESVLTLFEPILETNQTNRRFPPVVIAYIKLHAIIFTRRQIGVYDATMAEYTNLLDKHIDRVNKRFLEQGYCFSISECIALLGYGSSTNRLTRFLSPVISSEAPDVEMGGIVSQASLSNESAFDLALSLFINTASIILARPTDPNVLSYIHCILVFLYHVSGSSQAFQIFENRFPWQPLATILNYQLQMYKNYSRIEGEQIPVGSEADFRPFPEDFAMRGLSWTQSYYPKGWFDNKNIDDENQYKDDASVDSEFRPERILWLGCRLANRVDCMKYNPVEHKFFVPGYNRASPLEQEVDNQEVDKQEVYSDTDSITLCGPDDMSIASSRTPLWDADSGRPDGAVKEDPVPNLEERRDTTMMVDSEHMEPSRENAT